MHIDPMFNSLYIGTVLRRGTALLEVTDRNDAQAIVKDTETGKFEIIPAERFSELFEHGGVDILARRESVVDFERIERLLNKDAAAQRPSERAANRRRACYVHRYFMDRPRSKSELAKMIRLEAARSGDRQPPCVRSVYSWIAQVRAADGRMGVLHGAQGQKVTGTRQSKIMVHLMDDVLFDNYFKPNSASLKRPREFSTLGSTNTTHRWARKTRSRKSTERPYSAMSGTPTIPTMSIECGVERLPLISGGAPASGVRGRNARFNSCRSTAPLSTSSWSTRRATSSVEYGPRWPSTCIHVSSLPSS